MRIVIVGGAGAMGKIIARDLGTFGGRDTTTVIADYDEKAAAAVAGRRMESAFIDVTDPRSVGRVFKDATVIINSTPYQWNVAVMEGALKAGAHYVDLGGLFHVTRRQLKLDKDFKKRGRLALLGMGAAPGISNILARMAADRLERTREIHIRLGSKDLTRYQSLPALPVSYSLKTILEEFSLKPAVFEGGRFRFVEPMSGGAPHRFPDPVGILKPFHTLHSEVATLPLSFRGKGVREVTFKIAFDDDFVDKVRFLRDMGFASPEPVTVRGCSVAPIEYVNRIAMAQRPAKRMGRLRQYEIVRAIVKGTTAGKAKTIIADCHTSGMPAWGLGTDINTGSPPAIAAMMLLRGDIRETGALPPECVVPPELFVKELAKRRMKVHITEGGPRR